MTRGNDHDNLMKINVNFCFPVKAVMVIVNGHGQIVLCQLIMYIDFDQLLTKIIAVERMFSFH